MLLAATTCLLELQRKAFLLRHFFAYSKMMALRISLPAHVGLASSWISVFPFLIASRPKNLKSFKTKYCSIFLTLDK